MQKKIDVVKKFQKKIKIDKVLRKKLYFNNLKNRLNEYILNKSLKKTQNLNIINKENFEIFFKLLFLLPLKKIKIIKRVLRLFVNLNIELRKFLIWKLNIIFKTYIKQYFTEFLKKFTDKPLVKNIFLIKFKSSFFKLQFNQKRNTGLLYLKFPKSLKKRKLTNLNYISFNPKIEDSNQYKTFFLGNTDLIWRLINWKKISKKEENLKRWTRRWIFVFPFLITIKPCTIIIKNIFFKTFFIISKWFRSSTKKEERFLFGKRIKKVFSNLNYSLYVSVKKNRNFAFDNYTKKSSFFIWHILNKYNYYLNHMNYTFKFKNKGGIPLLSNNLYMRKLGFIKKMYLQSRLNKRSNRRYWKFLSFYKNQWATSFIGLSFFVRLYNLYFFWFLYFFNKLFYFFNKIIFNLWFRFFFFMTLSTDIKDNYLFYNYKVLYKNLDVVYNLNVYFEFENIFSKVILKLDNILFKLNNLMILKNVQNNFYKNYSLIMFLFFYKNYFLLNIYYNYNKYLINIRYKTFHMDNSFFDMLYKENYSYKIVRNPRYRIIQKRIDFKYPGYFEVNLRKYKKMSSSEKVNYLELITKRQSCLFLK